MQVVWCAQKFMVTQGITYQAGDVVAGAEQFPGFIAMRNQEMIEPMVQREDGSLAPVPYKARRPISVGGRKYLPGDVLPDSVRSWPSYAALRRNQWSTSGWLEPITKPSLIEQIEERRPPAPAKKTTGKGGGHKKAHAA